MIIVITRCRITFKELVKPHSRNRQKLSHYIKTDIAKRKTARYSALGTLKGHSLQS